jgi:hypothetical protein
MKIISATEILKYSAQKFTVFIVLFAWIFQAFNAN